MYEAMANAVGDDVYRDDPTIIELEELVADTLGFEADYLNIWDAIKFHVSFNTLRAAKSTSLANITYINQKPLAQRLWGVIPSSSCWRTDH